jgi:hypothetical protein
MAHPKKRSPGNNYQAIAGLMMMHDEDTYCGRP